MILTCALSVVVLSVLSPPLLSWLLMVLVEAGSISVHYFVRAERLVPAPVVYGDVGLSGGL